MCWRTSYSWALAGLTLAVLAGESQADTPAAVRRARIRAVQARSGVIPLTSNQNAFRGPVFNQFNNNGFSYGLPYIGPPYPTYPVGPIIVPAGRPIGIRPTWDRTFYNVYYPRPIVPWINPLPYIGPNAVFNPIGFNPALNPVVGNPVFNPFAGINNFQILARPGPFGLAGPGGNLPFGQIAGF